MDVVRETVCSKEFTWPCDWAIALVDCESSNGAGEIGYELYDSNSDGILEQWYFYGWFQIASRIPPGGEMDWLLQPYLNTVEGHYKYHTEGVSAWPNCP